MRATPRERWLALPVVFSTAEAEATGLARSTVRRAAARKALVQVGDGVCAEAERWAALPPWERTRALALAAGRMTAGTAASHVGAAAIRGLPSPRQRITRAHLTALDTSKTGWPDDWRRVHQATLSPHEVEVIDGVRVTDLARTTVDCARLLGLPDALAIADAALRGGMIDQGSLRRTRRQQARWPGVSRVDEVLLLADGRRESWLESASAAHAHRWGWPRAATQIWIYDLSRRLVGRVDSLIAELGVIGEADGLGKFRGDFDGDSSETAMVRRVVAARHREREFEKLGFGVARWGTIDLAQGAEGLNRELHRAVELARPDEIACWWRPDLDSPLLHWSDFWPSSCDGSPIRRQHRH